jgi:hypothetical protein
MNRKSDPVPRSLSERSGDPVLTGLRGASILFAYANKGCYRIILLEKG